MNCTPSDLERLVYHMPTVASAASNDWEKSFAESIVKQSRRRNWKPSQKQIGLMRRMVSDLFSYRAIDTDGEVLE